MTAEHVPGPWRIVEHSWSRTGIYAGDFIGIAALDIEHSATEETQDAQEAVMAANARLIAAAPDLLAALQKVWEEGVIPDGFAILQDQVCDAIAKATGETP
jgi:hypothetical protein